MDSFRTTQPSAAQAATETRAQPNAQVADGGFSNKVKGAMSGDPGVDDVQKHVERKSGAGAEAQMDEAQRLQNEK